MRTRNNGIREGQATWPFGHPRAIRKQKYSTQSEKSKKADSGSTCAKPRNYISPERRARKERGETGRDVKSV